MALTAMPFVKSQWFTSAGAPAASYKLFTYASGTTTKLATYTDSTGATPNANPVVLDSAGRADVFLSPVAYKFVLAPPSDTDPPVAPIWTEDGILAVPGVSSVVDVAATFGEAVTAGQAVYLSDGSGSKTAGFWYIADAANSYSSSVAVNVGFAVASAAALGSGTARTHGLVTGLSGLTAGTLYYIGTAGALTSTPPTNARQILQGTGTTAGVAGIIWPTLVEVLGSRTINNSGVATVGTIKATATPNFKPGSSATYDAFTPGVLYATNSNAANVGTAETALMSYTLPAAVFNGSNTKSLRITVPTITFGANGNTKTVRLYFGATPVTCFTGVQNAIQLKIDAIILDQAPTTQTIVSWALSTTGTAATILTRASAGPAETVSGTVLIKLTGQSNAASGDVTAIGFIVEYLNNA